MSRFDYSPVWIKKKYAERDELPLSSSNRNQITDFLALIESVWRISSEEYQSRIWVNHESSDIVDSFDDTTMYFCEDADAVLQAHKEGRVKMSDQQYHMLKKLYDMVDSYDGEPNIPFKKYGRVDRLIVNDPAWEKVRNFAKLVYEELIK